MKFLFLALVLILIASNFDAFGQFSSEITSPKASVNGTDAKVHPILIKWQNAENLTDFAKYNNLAIKENTVRVYIYLTSQEHLSSIESEVQVISSYKKIVDSYVTSAQINALKDLDYVEKITLPEFAKTPPIPSAPIQQPEQDPPEEYLFWIIPALLGVLIIFIIYTKKRTNLSA